MDESFSDRALDQILEDKANNCLIIAQRLLPGSSDSEIESQAVDLMHLPLDAVNATLARQERFARALKYPEQEQKSVVLRSRYDVAKEQK